MKIISTPDAPTPAGHYSQAVVYGGVVYVAGMLGIDPRNPDADPGDAAQQTAQALANVSAVLEAAGSDLTRVVRMMVYVSGHDLWGDVNTAYAEAMGDHRPARAIVPVQSFREPFVVEIVATAALGG
jgi:2-iminobutanoate/2-iminopropanoate deaminase